MATYGRVEPFYEDVEIWDAYVERLDQYFVANDITENAKKMFNPSQRVWCKNIQPRSQFVCTGETR